MPQTKRARINGKKYPWPHIPMVQPMKPIMPNVFRKVAKKPAGAFWGDADGDGIYNAFDCAPRNKRRQGPVHGGIGRYKIASEAEYEKAMAKAEKRIEKEEQKIKEERILNRPRILPSRLQ